MYMFQVLAALGRIASVFGNIGNILGGVADKLGQIVDLGLYGAGGVVLKLSEKVFGGIENTKFFKEFNIKLGAKYMTPFGSVLYWNEIQQQIYRANKNLGIAGQLSETLYANTVKAGTASMDFGFSEKQIVETYKDFINEYERNQVFSEDDLQRITAVGQAFDQSFTKLFATRRLYGGTIEDTYNFLEGLNKKLDRYGLNTKKVFSDIQSNIRNIDKYNFKNGEEGLANMVIQANKLGMKMDAIAGFAEKVYNPEGAIEVAAQLQMLGGAFAQQGDAFKLMYEASNDVDALTKSLSEMTRGMGQVNKLTGEIDLSPLELRRLREGAKITGQALEDLSRQAKLQKKEDIISQFLPNDLKKFGNIDEFTSKIASMATFKDGVPKILIEGQQKLVSELKDADLNKLSSITIDQNDDSIKGLILANRTTADQMQTFGDKLTRAMNPVSSLNVQLEILNGILSKGNESLKNGNLKNITNVVAEAQKGSGEAVGRVLKPMFNGQVGEGFGNWWENMDLKASVNKGTMDSTINMMGGPNSGGGKAVQTFMDFESTIHDGFTSFASSVSKFGESVSKMGNPLSTPFSSASNFQTYSNNYNARQENITFFKEHEDARRKLEDNLTQIGANSLSINSANSTHKIEFSWNGKTFNTYDLLKDPKFKEMLRQDMGETAANMLMSHFTNGGKNTVPLDTIPK